MRRIAGCVLAVVVLLAASAQAEAASAPSKVTVFTVAEIGPGANTAVIGTVTSTNRRCLGSRRIEVTVTKPGGEVPLDVARSGKNGGWYARGATGLLGNASAIHAKLEKRKVGTGPSAIRCGGDKQTLTGNGRGLARAAGAGTAGLARRVKASTDLTIEAMTNTSSDAILIGSIFSNRSKCLDNRKVRVTVIPQSGPKFAFDVARTGGGGGWFALHDLDEVQAILPIDAVVVSVAKRKVPLSGGRTLVCGADRLRRAIT